MSCRPREGAGGARQAGTTTLEECETSDPVDPQVRERLRNMLGLFRTIDAWYRDIMSLPGAELKRLVGMRQKVRKAAFPSLMAAAWHSAALGGA